MVSQNVLAKFLKKAAGSLVWPVWFVMPAVVKLPCLLNTIQSYDPSWALSFLSLKAVYLQGLSGFEVDIQHVGSTSIPGVAAKPILDIDIILRDPADLPRVSAALRKLGYRDEGEKGIPGRFAFRQRSVTTPFTATKREWPEHHLYVCYPDALALKNHLMFRDLLLARPDLVAKYSALKLELASRPGMTRELYTSLKTDFIVGALAGEGLNGSELLNITKANTLERNP